MKKAVSAVLAALLAFSCVACSESNTENADVETKPEVVVENVEADAEEETEGIPAPELPEKNYDGAVFTCITRGRFATSFPEPFLSADELNGEVVNDAVFNRNINVEEQFNINLNIVENPDAADELRKLILAGDNSVDVADTMATQLASMSMEGMLYNFLNLDYINLDADYWSKYVKNDLQIAGKLFMMPSDISMNRLEYAFFHYFNKELIKAYNLEDPYTLIDEGRWTIDRFLEYITTVTADLNGDGVYDKNDLYGILYETNEILYYLVGCGIDFTGRDDSGKLVVTAYSEKAESVIEKFRAGYGENNVISYQKIGQGADITGFNNYWEWARTLFADRHYLFLDLGMFELMNLRDMEDDFGLAPMPKYDEEQEDYYHRINQLSCIFSIPIICPDLDRVGIILEYASYISNRDVLPAYYETTVKQKRIRDEKAAEVVDIVRRTARYQIADVYDLGISSVLIESFEQGNFASKYAKMEKVINKKAEKLYETINGLGS